MRAKSQYKVIERHASLTAPSLRHHYYTTLLLAAAISISLSLLAFPLLLSLAFWPLYLIIILMALGFGLILDVFVAYVPGLQEKHYAWAGIIILAFAFLNFFIISIAANSTIQATSLETPTHNALLISIAFAVAFILPYVYGRMAEIIS